MITLQIDGTEFTLRPKSAENVRALCASIKAKGKGRKFKPEREQLKMARQYPTRAESTGEYAAQYESLNAKIFGTAALTRWAPLNYNPTTHYDPREPIVYSELTAGAL
jgi:hypothetical protein